MNIVTKNIIVLSAIPIMGTLALLQPSCQYIDAAKSALSYSTTSETTEQIISDAEKTADIGDDTVNTFLKIDYDNRVFLNAHAPSVHAFAQKLRHNDMALNAIKQLRSATITFKKSTTTDNRASLMTLIATVKQIISDTKTNMATANALTP